MKLSRLNEISHGFVFLEFFNKLKKLRKSSSRVITERKITIEIDDSDEMPRVSLASPVAQQQLPAPKAPPSFNVASKDEFVNKALAIGNFNDPTWVSQLINGMKQSGVQGLDHVDSENQPVGRAEIKQLIALLVDLVNGT